MSEYEFTMSLRIRHPNVEPAEITRTLGIKPLHTWRAGDASNDPTDTALDGPHQSHWIGRLMAAPELASDEVGVESEVLRTLGLLRRSFRFLETLKEAGGAAELHVSIFGREQFRLVLLPETLGLLGRLGLTVTFEIDPQRLGVPARNAACER